jgi:hypothetical protein
MSAWVIILAVGRTMAVLPQLFTQICECGFLFERNLSLQIWQVIAQIVIRFATTSSSVSSSDALLVELSAKAESSTCVKD